MPSAWGPHVIKHTLGNTVYYYWSQVCLIPDLYYEKKLPPQNFYLFGNLMTIESMNCDLCKEKQLYYFMERHITSLDFINSFVLLNDVLQYSINLYLEPKCPACYGLPSQVTTESRSWGLNWQCACRGEWASGAKCQEHRWVTHLSDQDRPCSGEKEIWPLKMRKRTVEMWVQSSFK